MYGMAIEIKCTTLLTLTSIILSYSSTLFWSQLYVRSPLKALLTRMSIRPNSSIVLSNRFFTSSSLLRSTTNESILFPSDIFSHFSATLLILCSSVPVMTTLAPNSAKRCAYSSPIPELEPNQRLEYWYFVVVIIGKMTGILTYL